MAIIQICLDEGEDGNPMEIANAIVKAYVGNKFDPRDEEWFRLRQGELAQIANHIQTYLEYNCPGYLRRV